MQESLRRAVLSQVREIKELKSALEEEKAKNAKLEARVALLEAELHKAKTHSSPRVLSTTGSPRSLGPMSGRALKKTNSFVVEEQSAPAPDPDPDPVPEVANVEQEAPRVASSVPVVEDEESVPPGEPAKIDFASAVLILRLMERADVAHLGRTCKSWHALCQPYLREWRRTRLVLEVWEKKCLIVYSTC